MSAPELEEARKLALRLGAEETTGFLVCVIGGENVGMALKLEDADLFALWAHLAGVLLSGVSDKHSAMRAMATALAMHGFEANVRSDRPAGSTH